MTPAHDTHLLAGKVVLLTIPPESDPSVQRDPDAWRPTFDLERGYWVERAELLNEVNRLAARVAELEAGLRPFADRAERLRQTQSVVEGLGRVSPMQFVDVEDLIRAAALLAPPESPP